jgi:predicted ATPase
MKNPDDPSDDDLEAIVDEMIDPSKLSRDELRAHLEKKLERLRRERRELSDKLQEHDPSSDTFAGLMKCLDQASNESKKTESQLARLPRQTGITAITIENFKGFSTRVNVPLRPITLLFGANSAGKSTILQALHYVRELLDRNNANPDHTLLGGEAIEMGGFRNLVHKHDLKREIRICVEITPTDDGVPTLEEILELTDQEDSQEHLNINSQVRTVALELASRWDLGREEGWFSECKYLLNGEAVVTIRKPKPESLPVIEEIQYFHPALLALDESLVELKKLCEQEMVRFRSELVKKLFDSFCNRSRTAPPHFGFDVVRSDTGEVVIKRGQMIDRDLINRLVENLPEVACAPNAEELLPPGRVEIEQAVKQFQERQHEVLKGCGFFPLIQLSGQVSPSPSFVRPLPFPPSALGDEGQPYWATINQIVIGITALVHRHLDGFRYIGPIRAIPDRHHESPQVEDPARWSSGLGAWDLLLRHYDRAQGKGDAFVEEVSRWFENKDRLGLGYRIEVTGLRSVAEDSLLMNHLKLLQTQYDERSQHDFREIVLNPLQSAPQTPRIRIVDTRTGTEVGPKDIGMGVAQALPILVGALDSRSPFLAVEQPELHLHPAAQARLGDLFISAAKSGRQFILETHSELLILRLLKRIRQTTANELPTPQWQFIPDELAVIHVERSEDATMVTVLDVDRQGEFIRQWPGKDGFFEERARELFE